RRDFIKGIVGSASAWPLAARPQQRERLRRIAILVGTARDVPGAQDRDTAFFEAFEQLGWTNRRNVQIEVRWSEGNDVKARKYADELVALAPDVILGRRGRSHDVKGYSNYPDCLCGRPRSYGLRLRSESVATGPQCYRLYGV